MVSASTPRNHLETLYQVSRALNSSLDLEEALALVIDSAIRLAGAERGFLMLYDEAGLRLDFRIARNANREALDEAEFEVSRSVVQEVARTGKSVVTLDAQRDPRFTDKASVINFLLRSIMAVPLKVQGRITGLLYVDSKTHEAEFGQGDLDWLGAFADQAATALLNAQLYESQKREAEIRRVLFEVARAAQTAGSVRELTRTLVNSVAEWLDCDRGMLFLYDADARVFQPEAFSRQLDRDFFNRIGPLRPAELPLVEQVLTARQPQRLALVELMEGLPAEWFIGEQPPEMLLVPVWAEMALIGVLTLDNITTGRLFSRRTLEVVDSLGDALATAIRRLQLFETSQRQLKELKFLNAVSLIVTEATSLEELTERVMDVINPLFDSHGLGVNLLDEDSHRLFLYPPGRWGKEIDAGIPFGTGIVGQVASTGHSRRVADVSQDPDYFELNPSTRSELAVPLKVGERVIGVLNIESPDLNAFSLADEQLLTTVAGQLAAAIERQRAREVEREQRALAEALRDVGLAMPLDADLNVVLSQLLDHIARVVPYDAAAVQVVSGEYAVVAGVRGYERFGPQVVKAVQALKFEIATTANLRRMAATGQPLIIPDVNEDPDWVSFPDVPRLRSWLGIPILVGQQPLAFIDLEKTEPNFYRPEHARRLAAFSGHATLALRNVVLFQSEARRVAELDAVRRASLSLTSSLTVHEVLDAVLAGALSLLPNAQNVSIYLFSNERLSFGSVLWADGSQDHSVPPPRPEGLTYTVARTGEPVIVSDMTAHRLFADAPHDWRGAIIGLPLRMGARVVGVMNASYPTPRSFPEAELRILQLLGEQAAVAIENARLFDATRQQVDELTLLHSVAVAGADSGSFDALIERATQMIGAALQANNLGVLLLDANGLALQPHASYLGQVAAVVPLGEGIAGRVAAGGRAWRSEEGARAGMCVPLKSNDRVIGVINVESEQREAFTEADERLLTTVAGQLATAIEKVRLFEAERAARAQAETLRDVTSLFNAASDRAVLLSQLLDQLARLVRYDSASVMLLEGAGLLVAAQRGWPTDPNFPNPIPLHHLPYIPIVLEDRRPFLVTDTQTDTRWLRTETTAHVQCWLGVPLVVKDKAIGVLNLDSMRAGFYTTQDAEMALALANQAAVALERLQLLEQTQQSERELSILLNVARTVSSSLEVEEVIQHVTTSLAQTVRLDVCIISSYDPQARSVKSLGVHVEQAGLGYVYSTQQYFLEDFPLTRRVIDQSEVWIVRVNDPQADVAERQLLKQFGCAALLIMSIRASGRPVGLIELFSRDVDHVFTDSDIRLARAIADQTGVAFENSRLFQAERDQRELAEALRNAAITLSANLDFDAILDRFLDQITQVLPYDSASVLLVDAVTGRARSVRQRGYEQFGPTAVEAARTFALSVVETPTLQHMAETGQPLVIADTAHYPGWIYFEPLAHVRSFAAAPVMAQGRVVAFFQLDKAETGFYQPKHAQRLAAFAGQAALALQNARLFEAERERVDALTALHEIGLELSAQLDLPALLKTLVSSAVRLLDTQMGAFYTFQAELNRLELAASHQLPPYLQGRHLQVGEGLAGRVALTGEPMIIGDYQAVFGAMERSSLNRVRSVLGVPVQWQGQLLGALTLIDERPNRFSEFDTEVVRLFADQAAIAIENVRLYGALAREKQRLELLLKLSQSLASTLNPQEVAERAMTLMCSTTGAIRAAMFTLEADGQHLRPVKSLGYSESQLEIMADLKLMMGQGVVGYAAQMRKPVLASEVQSDPYWLRVPGLDDEIRSAAALPLLAGDELVGVLALNSDRERFITEEQVPLLTAAAVSVALALQNARLFETEASRVYYLTLLNEITQVAVTVEHLPALLAAMADRLGELAGADASAIVQWDETRQRALVQEGEAPAMLAGAAELTELVLRSGQPLAIEDVFQSHHFNPAAFAPDAPQSMLGLPLIAGDQKLGAALLAFQAPRSFNRDEIRRNEQATRQIALAIARARLFEETRHNAEELARASELLRSLNMRSGLLHEFEPIAEGLRALAKCQHVGMALLTSARAAFTLVGVSRATQAPLAQMQRVLASPSVVTEAAAGQPIFVPDLTAPDSEFIETFIGTSVRSLVVLPLRAGEQVIGALALLWQETSGYSHTHLTLLGQVAEALALAVEKDRLLDETLHRAQELEALTQVSAALRSVETTRAALQLLLEHSMSVFRAEAGAVFVPTEDGTALRHAEHLGLPADIPTFTLPLQSSIAGQVFHTGRPYLANDLFNDPLAEAHVIQRWRELDPRLHSAIYAPLRAGTEIGGVLCINIAQPHAFSEADLRLVSAIAEVGGSALQRARVLETLEQRVADRTRELAAANERLKELDRLKDQFVSNVSHELRTPLTAIKLHLGLLDKRGAELLPRYLPVLQRETDRLHRLIEDLLDLSRLRAQSTTPKRELLHLDNMLEDVLALYASRAEEREITLRHLPNTAIPPVLVDQAQIVRVFTNLIGNAVAYTSVGGQVTVSSRLEASGALEGVAILFHNDGLPIPSDDLQHLFIRFYRGKTARESGEPGTGLGLAICKEIMQWHGGDITVDSTTENGTTFTVWLPLASEIPATE